MYQVIEVSSQRAFRLVDSKDEAIALAKRYAEAGSRVIVFCLRAKMEVYRNW